MSNLEKYLTMLQSEKASVRYEACEELRVSDNLSKEALLAIQKTTNDIDPLVADAARRALLAHSKSTIICPLCGTENSDNELNCRLCGTNFEFAFENPEEIQAIKQQKIMEVIRQHNINEAKMQTYQEPPPTWNAVKQKPKLVSVAILLFYIQLGLYVITFVVNNYYNYQFNQNYSPSSFICLVVYIPIFLLLVFQSSKGKIWARNLLLIWFIWQTLTVIWLIYSGAFMATPWAVSSLIVMIVGLGATILLYLEPSKTWYDYHKAMYKVDSPANKKSRILLLGLLGSLLGIVITCTSFFSFSYALRGNPEYSVERVVVPANDELILLVESQDGRYEYQIYSDQYINGYLINADDLALYKEGKKFFIGDSAEQTRSWSTFIQTGLGSDFALILINQGHTDANASANLTFYPNPKSPDFYFALIGFGILIFIAGVVATIIGIVKSIQKRRAEGE